MSVWKLKAMQKWKQVVKTCYEYDLLPNKMPMEMNKKNLKNSCASHCGLYCLNILMFVSILHPFKAKSCARRICVIWITDTTINYTGEKIAHLQAHSLKSFCPLPYKLLLSVCIKVSTIFPIWKAEDWASVLVNVMQPCIKMALHSFYHTKEVLKFCFITSSIQD